MRAGWLCGPVRPDKLPVNDDKMIRPPRSQVPALLAVDCAEHERDAVWSLVRWGYEEVRKKLRILLLARSAGEWWQPVHGKSRAVREP